MPEVFYSSPQESSWPNGSIEILEKKSSIEILEKKNIFDRISESRIIILKCILSPSTEINFFVWLLDYPNLAVDRIQNMEAL